jgi:tRNA(Ile)-lysidine synthase
LEIPGLAEQYNWKMAGSNETSLLLRRVQQTIAEHQMIEKDDRVVAGVSGGADSVCLLLVLKELGYEVAAAHLNHGLRGEAAHQDEAFVKDLARRLGVAFFSKKVSLKGNLEAAGRLARREFFCDVLRQHGFRRIALAHTQNDRAETFLIHLFRGSGVEGLVSMSPVAGEFVRPLIDLKRNEVENYLGQRGQPWQTDATNLDLSFVRNRIRHKVLPQLTAEFNTNLVETLCRTIEILEAENAAMQSLAEQWLRSNAKTDEDQIILNATKLNSMPLSVVRRVLRTALRQGGFSLQDVSFEHIENMRLLLAGSKSGKSVQIPGGPIAEREFDQLAIRMGHGGVPDYEYELNIPGHVHIPELNKVFSAEIVKKSCNESSGQGVLLDAGSLGPYVRIRNWKPGDYYRPVGLPAGKLKKLFQQARIPRSQRRACPVFVKDSTIIWVASFPVSRDFVPGERTEKVVAINASSV